MIKVSLLYAKSGGGHLSLAKATEDALNTYYPRQFEFSYFDPFPRIYQAAYRRFGSDFQTIYGTLFRATNNSSSATAIHYPNQQLINRKLTRYFKETTPDVVISNNPLVTSEIKPALISARVPAKIAFYIADPFTPHRLWFSEKNADLYLSPSMEATRLAIDSSLPPQRIKTVGWLTRKDFFACPYPAAPIRKTLGLDPKKLILFVGGAGQGGGKIYNLCQKLLQNPQIASSCQVIVNTGLNPELATRIIRLSEKNPGFFHIVPYAFNMPHLLSVADLAIGKAGPNFLFESIHSLTPFFATGCLPGQEDGNLDFIKKSGIGWVSPDINQAVRLISQIVSDPKLLKSKQQIVKKIKHQHLQAPHLVAREIARLAGGHRRLLF